MEGSFVVVSNSLHRFEHGEAARPSCRLYARITAS